MDNNLENELKNISGEIILKINKGGVEVKSDIEDINTIIFLSRSLAAVIHAVGSKINQPIGGKLDLLEEVNDITRKWLCSFADSKIKRKEMVKYWLEESR